MKSNQTKKLLRLLEKNAGKKISRSELFKELSTKTKPDKKSKKGRQHSRPLSLADDPNLVLGELELLGMIAPSGRKLVPRKPFTAIGRVSLNQKGFAFVQVRGAAREAREIFVYPENALSALSGDTVEVCLTDRSRERFEGKVLRIVKRSRTYYRMRILPGGNQKSIPGLILDNPGRLTALLDTGPIPTDTRARLKEDQVVIVSLSGKQTFFKGAHFHEARFHRFEQDTDMNVDFVRVLYKYNLDPIYPENLIPKLPDRLREKDVSDLAARVELKKLYTVTIDGADAKDFDDALSLEKISNKVWKLYVHIADVSYYVKPDSPLDNEAARRGTSVYLSGRVVPMLPPVLSENLCSLVAGQPRLAFTAEMEVSPKDGKIFRSRFYKSIIQVDKRLTYDLAEAELDKGKNTFLNDLWHLAQIQKKRRIKEGRIDLNLSEPKFQTDREGDITAVSFADRQKSTMLIEECMLSANTSVSEFLRKKNADVLYRVHPPMDESKLETLNVFFQLYNIKHELKDASPPELQKALAEVKNHPRGESLERIFNLLLLRSFMQATYTGEPGGHWGLGFRDYCHFTSPIRRYPDLVVHRVLQNCLEKSKPLYTPEEIAELGASTSDSERKAMEAERDAIKLKMIRYVESLEERRFRGFITGFRPHRVFLELEGLGVEGVVLAAELTNDPELILPDAFSAYIKKLSRPAFLGEEWDLVIDRIDVEDMVLYCKPDWSRVKKAFE